MDAGKIVLCAVGVAALGGKAAHGQWAATSLHPTDNRVPGVVRSRAMGIHNGQQVGDFSIGAVRHACLWTGSASTCVDLAATSAVTDSGVYDVYNGKQAGWATVSSPSVTTAGAVWSGTSSSRQSLTQPGNPVWVASGIWEGQEVGWAYVGNVRDAGLWNGVPGTWEDLAPESGADDSYAIDCYDGWQVGAVRKDFGQGVQTHAALWHGTSASRVDLHPTGANLSDARGVYGGEQVGWARFGTEQHAGLWHGSAASWVDLHPAGASGSGAARVYAGWQVGFVTVNGVKHAAVWRGTAGSWEDLRPALSGVWGDTEATAVWVGGRTLYVTGFGIKQSPAPVHEEALLWMRHIACASDWNADGATNSTDVSDFINAWFEDQANGTLLTDWDFNGVVNSTDVSAFINSWFEDAAGGCA